MILSKLTCTDIRLTQIPHSFLWSPARDVKNPVFSDHVFLQRCLHVPPQSTKLTQMLELWSARLHLHFVSFLKIYTGKLISRVLESFFFQKPSQIERMVFYFVGQHNHCRGLDSLPKPQGKAHPPKTQQTQVTSLSCPN